MNPTRLVPHDGILGKVRSSVTLMRAGQWEAGIRELCDAIEASAKRKYPNERSTKTRFLEFLRSEFPIRLAGGKGSIDIKCHSDLQDDRGKDVGDQYGAFYSLFRCYTTHGETFSSDLDIVLDTDEYVSFSNTKPFQINLGFIQKLLECVTHCDTNKDMFTREVLNELH